MRLFLLLTVVFIPCSLPSSFQPLLQSSLTPYHAIPPKEMMRRAKMVEGNAESFVIDIQSQIKGGRNKRKANATMEVSRRRDLGRDASRADQSANSSFSSSFALLYSNSSSLDGRRSGQGRSRERQIMYVPHNSTSPVHLVPFLHWSSPVEADPRCTSAHRWNSSNRSSRICRIFGSSRLFLAFLPRSR